MIEEAVVTAKRIRRGRPRKDEQPLYLQVYKICLQVGELDQESYTEAKKNGPVFCPDQYY